MRVPPACANVALRLPAVNAGCPRGVPEVTAGNTLLPVQIRPLSRIEDIIRAIDVLERNPLIGRPGMSGNLPAGNPKIQE